MTKGEAEVSTFVDDPIVLATGKTVRQRSWTFAKFCTVWRVLGLDMSWEKAHRGARIDWIGFSVQLSNEPYQQQIVIRLMEAKRVKLQTVIDDMLKSQGMVPLAKLQLAAGILGWVTSAMPLARPFVAMLWAAIMKQSKPVQATTRVRKGLVFVKQVRQALVWLSALMNRFEEDCGGLQRVVRWRPFAPLMVVSTDACPSGMGGFLMVHNTFVAYWHDEVSSADEEALGVKKGDPAYQSELELLAVLISLRGFSSWLGGVNGQGQPAGMLLRADNTSTLAAAMDLRGKSELMAQLAAEVALEIEALQLPHIMGQHVPGIANDVADRLSRVRGHEVVPKCLQGATFVPVPERTPSFYRAWRLTQ